MKYLSKNEKQTKKIAGQLVKKLKGGEVIALTGNLGAGKTTFIQGLANGLKIEKNVNSPTFVLMKIYPVKSRGAGISPKAKLFNRVSPVKNSPVLYLCHVDAYRIKNPLELADIGALEYFRDKNTVSIIEWADKIKSILPKKIIEITIKHGKKENERTIDINYKKS